MAGVAPRDDRGAIAPSGPDRAPIAPSGPDQGEIALSLVTLLYKAASSATPAVRMVPGRSARILGRVWCCWGYRPSFFFLGEGVYHIYRWICMNKIINMYVYRYISIDRCIYV